MSGAGRIGPEMNARRRPRLMQFRRRPREIRHGSGKIIVTMMSWETKINSISLIMPPGPKLQTIGPPNKIPSPFVCVKRKISEMHSELLGAFKSKPLVVSFHSGKLIFFRRTRATYSERSRQ